MLRERTRAALTLPRLVLLFAALLLVSSAVVGCGGEDEDADTTETEATETTEEAESEGGMDTETTEPESEGDAGATDDGATGDDGTGDEGMAEQFEILNELPDDFPDIELPDDTTLLQARAGEVPDASGESIRIVVAAFESETEPREQYEHFGEALRDGGYEVLVDQALEDPTFFYTLVASGEERAVNINGGEDSSAFEMDFPTAENPFAVTVGPPGMF